jgi:hypothetical protein
MDQVSMQNAYKDLVAKHLGARARRVSTLGQEAKNLRILPVETKIDDEMLAEVLRKLKKKTNTRGTMLEIQMKAWASYVRAWVLEGI